MHQAKLARIFGLALFIGVVISCSDSSTGGGGGDDTDAGMDGGSSGGACATGALDCTCDGERCDDGECVTGMCTDCARGEEDCVCMSNGACDGELNCDNGLCKPCDPGSKDCGCDGTTCDGALVCTNDVCANDQCAVGTDTCPCASSAPLCGDGSYCDDNTICRACATDVTGCPCDSDGACSGGLVCESDTCEEEVNCASLFASGDCTANQVCDDDADAGPGCLADTCVDGYFWNATDGTCLKCASDDCSEEPSCDAGNQFSIVVVCANAFKECVEDSAGARCEGCVGGAKEVGDACIPDIPCGNTVCADDEYCDGNDVCQDVPCDAGQVQTSGGSCVNCPISCAAVGLTGRAWPFQDSNQNCFCETVPGYFIAPGMNINAENCDADGDGWVRWEADNNLDDARKANARCDILLVDGVILRDEYGIEVEVGSCNQESEGLVINPDSGNCTSRIPMRLLETERNDIPLRLNKDNGAPVYDQFPGTGGDGRLLKAVELTSLTKACVPGIADFNDYGDDDITEAPPKPDPGADDQTRLHSFSYFTELYRGSYVPSGDDSPGKFLIAERSRCDADFPLGYSDSDDTGYTTIKGAANTTYWRNCQRRRDAAFDTAINDPGFDFALWSCDSDQDDVAGSCSAKGPAHKTLISTDNDATKELTRDHGLCELGGAAPADGVWRGMGHHSQFKCVQVISSGVDVPSKAQYNASNFGPSGSMVLNVCKATDASEPTAPGSASYAPVINCTQVTGTPDSQITVAWAAVKFTDYGSYSDPYNVTPGGNTGAYENGCISEDAEYATMWTCPYPSFALDANLRAASFGRYTCGEDRFFLWADDPDATRHNYPETLWWGSDTGGWNGADPSINSVLR